MLYLFRLECATKEATKALQLALENNPYALQYLTGEQRIPAQLPGAIGFGDVSEAQVYVADHVNYWRRTPGALDWLQKHAGVAKKALKKETQKKHRPNNRYQMGDTVRIKPGVKDPDNPQNDLSRWQGNVIELEEGEDGPLVLIVWDAETLAQISSSSIEASMEEGLDWIGLDINVPFGR